MLNFSLAKIGFFKIDNKVENLKQFKNFVKRFKIFFRQISILSTPSLLSNIE